MGFAGAGAADEDCIALSVQEGAGGEFANLPFIDRRIGEDERVDIFEVRRAEILLALIGPHRTLRTDDCCHQ